MVPGRQPPPTFGTRPSWTAPRRRRVDPARRRRLVGRAVTAALVVGAVTAGDRRLDRARELEQRWGPTVDVLVARHDISAGAALTPGDVVTEAWPDLLVGNIGELPSGAVATRPIARGEPLMSSMFDDVTSIRAGELVVSVRPRQPTPEVGPGDRVALLGPDGRLDATVIAATRRQDSVGSDEPTVDLTVSVDADDATRLAGWADGDAVVALSGP